MNYDFGRFAVKFYSYIKGFSTGVPKILKAMEENGSPKPEFDTDDDRTYFLVRLLAHPIPEHTGVVDSFEDDSWDAAPTEKVRNLLFAVHGEMSRSQLMQVLGLKNRSHFVTDYLQPALSGNFVEMTDPAQPRSKKQRYRLTQKGRRVVGGEQEKP